MTDQNEQEKVDSALGAAGLVLSEAGARIKARRRAIDRSRRWVSIKVGVSPTTMSLVERRGFAMSEEKIRRLAEVLGMEDEGEIVQLLLDFGRCPEEAIPRTMEEVRLILDHRAGRVKIETKEEAEEPEEPIDPKDEAWERFPNGDWIDGKGVLRRPDGPVSEEVRRQQEEHDRIGGNGHINDYGHFGW